MTQNSTCAILSKYFLSRRNHHYQFCWVLYLDMHVRFRALEIQIRATQPFGDISHASKRNSSSFFFLFFHPCFLHKVKHFRQTQHFLRPHSLRACHSLVDFTYVYTYLYYTLHTKSTCTAWYETKKTCQTLLVLGVWRASSKKCNDEGQCEKCDWRMHKTFVTY